jgi:hypothetical protein
MLLPAEFTQKRKLACSINTNWLWLRVLQLITANHSHLRVTLFPDLFAVGDFDDKPGRGVAKDFARIVA